MAVVSCQLSDNLYFATIPLVSLSSYFFAIAWDLGPNQDNKLKFRIITLKIPLKSAL